MRRNHLAVRTRRLAVAVLAAVVILPGPAAVVAAPTPRPAPSALAGDVIEGSILVRFRENVGPAARGRVGASVAATHSRAFGLVPGLVAIRTDLLTSVALARLRADPDVLYAEPDRTIAAAIAPDDPDFDAQWPLHETGDHDIDAPEAWDITTGSASIVVAVIDSGIDLGHPDLAANVWTNPGEVIGNGLDDDANGFVDDVNGWDFWDDDDDPSDELGHGTHVAGTIAAIGDNGVGIAGVSWSSRLMPLRVLGADGYGSVSDGIAAIDYAWRHDARVANLSWGYVGGVVQPLADVVAAAVAEGMVVVAAAGNAAADIDLDPYYPAALDIPELLTVAAVDVADGLAGFSNIGPGSVDLAAPGVDVWSTVPGGYAFASGTSMASPHVAGTAALLLATEPGLSVAEVRNRILAGVRPLPGLAGLVATGGTLNTAATLTGPADAPPIVTITAPMSGFEALSGTSVTFGATAVDDEDGSLTSTISWTSSLDGPIGSGASVSTTGLSAGVHLVSAIAVDSGDHVVTATVRVRIGPVIRRVAASAGDWFPIVAVDDGTVVVAYGRMGTGTYLARRGPAGTWSAKLAVASFSDQWLDAAVGTDGAVRIAIQRDWSSTAVYGDPGILVAVQDGPGWRVDRVTDACTDGAEGCHADWTPKLAIGPDGRERIVFIRSGPHGGGPTATTLELATRLENGAWTVETVADEGDALTPAVAVSSNGASHVAYIRTDPATAGTWYATDESGAWQTTRLSSGTADVFPSIVVAQNGNVSVAVGTEAGARVRTRFGSTWGAWTTPIAGPTGSTDLAVDAAGKLRLVAGRIDASRTAAGISYATNASGAWVATSLSTGQDIDPSIALGANGSIHVVWRAAWPTTQIRHATNEAGGWVTKAVASGGMYQEPGYAIDGRGVAHAAAARHGTAPGLWYGTDEGGTWTWGLAVPGETGGGVSMAVNSIGEATVAYQREVSGIWGAYVTANASGTWQSTLLGTSAGSATPSLLLDVAGKVHVAWVGTAGGSTGVFYATNQSGAWVTKRLTTADEREVAMAMDAAGHLHLAVSRQTASGAMLVYLTNASGQLVRNTLSFGVQTYDWQVSIALDAAGAPSIAYARLGEGIRLTERRPSGWATRIVTPDPFAHHPSLRVDSDGTRQLLFANGGNYASCLVPLCPDYPGTRHALGGPTGPFVIARITASAEESAPVIVRGRDGALAGAFVDVARGIFEVRLERPPGKAATSIAYQGPTTLIQGATEALSATLTAGPTPLAGRTLVFKVDGVTIGSAVTNASGVATRTWSVTAAPGSHRITVGFAGGAGYLAARAGPLPVTVAS